MRLQSIQRGLQGMYRDGPDAHRTYRIDQKWNECNMVQVRMRDKHMIDADHFLDGQAPYTRTGIDQHIIVEQQGCGLLAAANTATTSENSESQKFRPDSSFDQ